MGAPMRRLRRTLHRAADLYLSSTPQRVFAFSVLPILCASSMLLGFQCRRVGVRAITEWLEPSSLAAASPSGAVVEATDRTASEKWPGLGSSPPNSGAQPGEDNEALVMASQKMQQLETDLEGARRELAQTQWDLTIWKQQAMSSEAERDRALREVDDLTKQVRDNFLELNSAQQKLENMQEQSKADRERIRQLEKSAKSAGSK
jgi:hypothetical protein